MSEHRQDGQKHERENLSDRGQPMTKDIPSRLLAAVVARMPDDRREWGEAMLAELAQLQGSACRWSFAFSCLRVALFPPGKHESLAIAMKSILPLLAIVGLIAFALLQPEISGAALARAYMVYGIAVLAIPTALFANVVALFVVAWAVVGNAVGRPPWPRTDWLRQSGRLVVDLVFGLLNPVLYLAILTSAFGLRRSGEEWWLGPLTAAAWILVIAFWIVRLCGGAFNRRSLNVRTGVRVLLMSAMACLFVFTLKDAWFLYETIRRGEGEVEMGALRSMPLMFLRLCPLYLIPALLLWDYLRSHSTSLPESQEPAKKSGGFFLLTNLASRFAVALVVGTAVVTLALAAHRRSEGSARKLVSDHRALIQASAARYDVDPRLIASIILVTHRDQLSPFRDAVERLITSTWAMKMQRRGPGNEQWEQIGTDENPMLNVPLDISVGLAQIKPRTAQTASVLATGKTPDTLATPSFYEYRNVEPVGKGWPPSVTRQLEMSSPIPVPSDRSTVAQRLLNTESNLETCALILALYQKQWEVTNPQWSIRNRPDILATLYQIGFARSNPHGAPRSNAFGNRVRQVYEQPWLGELFQNVP
jgi:hypothetical protein